MTRKTLTIINLDFLELTAFNKDGNALETYPAALEIPKSLTDLPPVARDTYLIVPIGLAVQNQGGKTTRRMDLISIGHQTDLVTEDTDIYMLGPFKVDLP